MPMKRNRTGGFTLIELMVASTAMLILVGGLATVFLTQNRSYKLQTDLVEARGSGRLALEFMMREMRDAGYHVPATLLPVCQADAQTVKIHGDWNDDGYVDQVIFEYDAVNDLLVRRYLAGSGSTVVDCTQQGAPETLAERVVALQFRYYDNANPPALLGAPVVASDLTFISKIDVELTIATPEDPWLTNASGLSIDVNPATPGRARIRTLDSQVTLRNLIFRMG